MRGYLCFALLVLLCAAANVHGSSQVTCVSPPLASASPNPLASCAMVQYDVAVAQGQELTAMAGEQRRKDALDAFLSRHGSVQLLDTERCHGAKLSFGCALSMPKCMHVHTSETVNALPPCRHTCRAFLDACVEPNARYATELAVCGHLPSVGGACGHVPMLFTRPEAVEGMVYVGDEMEAMGVKVRYGVNNIIVKHVSGKMSVHTTAGKVHLSATEIKVNAVVDWWEASTLYDDSGRGTAEAELNFETDLRVIMSPTTHFQTVNVVANPDIKLHVFDTPLAVLKNYAINLFEKDIGALVKTMVPDLVAKLVVSQMSSEIAQFLADNPNGDVTFGGEITINNRVDEGVEKWVDALALVEESEGAEGVASGMEGDDADVVATASAPARLVDAEGNVTELPLFE